MTVKGASSSRAGWKQSAWSYTSSAGSGGPRHTCTLPSWHWVLQPVTLRLEGKRPENQRGEIRGAVCICVHGSEFQLHRQIIGSQRNAHQRGSMRVALSVIVIKPLSSDISVFAHCVYEQSGEGDKNAAYIRVQRQSHSMCVRDCHQSPFSLFLLG
jgi:hypothetical protein